MSRQHSEMPEAVNRHPPANRKGRPFELWVCFGWSMTKGKTTTYRHGYYCTREIADHAGKRLMRASGVCLSYDVERDRKPA